MLNDLALYGETDAPPPLDLSQFKREQRRADLPVQSSFEVLPSDEEINLGVGADEEAVNRWLRAFPGASAEQIQKWNER